MLLIFQFSFVSHLNVECFNQSFSFYFRSIYHTAESDLSQKITYKNGHIIAYNMCMRIHTQPTIRNNRKVKQMKEWTSWVKACVKINKTEILRQKLLNDIHKNIVHIICVYAKHNMPKKKKQDKEKNIHFYGWATRKMLSNFLWIGYAICWISANVYHSCCVIVIHWHHLQMNEVSFTETKRKNELKWIFASNPWSLTTGSIDAFNDCDNIEALASKQYFDTRNASDTLN